METPKHSAPIFEVLSKGQFISSNSSDEQIRRLYNTLDDEIHFEALHLYFQGINFQLERGADYYYFSRNENKIDVERKIEQAFKWIDVMDFFKTYDTSFGAGFRFSASEILVKINVDAQLKMKLEGLRRYTTGRDKFADVIQKIADDLRKDRFIELENEMTQQYKVLSAFQYLEQLIMSIHIADEVKNEIPE